MFEKTDSIIQKVMNQKGLGKIAVSSQVCFEAEMVLAKMFPRFKDQVDIASFKAGVLKISVLSPTINSEVQMQKQQLVKNINQNLKTDIIKDIRFILKAKEN